MTASWCLLMLAILSAVLYRATASSYCVCGGGGTVRQSVGRASGWIRSVSQGSERDAHGGEASPSTCDMHVSHKVVMALRVAGVPCNSGASGGDAMLLSAAMFLHGHFLLQSCQAAACEPVQRDTVSGFACKWSGEMTHITALLACGS